MKELCLIEITCNKYMLCEYFVLKLNYKAIYTFKRKRKNVNISKYK